MNHNNYSISKGNLQSNHKKWNRKQKRGYHRVQSCLTYWQKNGFQVLWVCLTTAPGGDSNSLAYHHQKLRQRIERKLNYNDIQHFQVKTNEGNGVLHIFWAWKGARSFYIPQKWLSSQWGDIHNAKIVWIKRLKRGSLSRNKISRYCISQYVTEQAGYQYMSWSWGRTFGFPIVACWDWIKRLCGDKKGNLMKWWNRLLSGGHIFGLHIGNFIFILGMEDIRQLYREWGSKLWEFY